MPSRSPLGTHRLSSHHCRSHTIVIHFKTKGEITNALQKLIYFACHIPQRVAYVTSLVNGCSLLSILFVLCLMSRCDTFRDKASGSYLHGRIPITLVTSSVSSFRFFFNSPNSTKDARFKTVRHLVVNCTMTRTISIS